MRNTHVSMVVKLVSLHSMLAKLHTKKHQLRSDF
jgi:hypothetical protein